jgi:hypothetical protein
LYIVFLVVVVVVVVESVVSDENPCVDAIVFIGQ